MKVVFTGISQQFFCDGLWVRFVALFGRYCDVVQSFEAREDSRILVVVLNCPCCDEDEMLNIKDAVLVSPFRGINPRGWTIGVPAKYPPFNKPGEGNEATSDEEFLEAFRLTIENALDRRAA